LLKARRNANSHTLTRIATRVALLEERLAVQRRSEAEKVIAAADDAAQREGVDHPFVIALITKNRALGEELTRLTSELEKVEAAAMAAANESKAIQKNFQSARERLEIAGLSQALGQILHDQRRDLPDLRRYLRRAARRVDIIAGVSLRDTQLEAERRESQHVASYVERLLVDVPSADRERLSTALGSLVTSRRALLKQTEVANSEYLRALGDLDFQESQLLSGAEEFDAYLAERLLWVRSKGPVGLESIIILPREVVGFLAPQQWLEAIKVLSTPIVALALLVAVLLLVGAGSLRARLRATRSEVGRPSSDRFALTAEAVGYSVLLSVSWPLLTGAAAFEISRSLDASEGVKAIGVGLVQTAWALFFLRLFRVICLSGGLAEVHFKWPSSSVVAFRRQLDQLLITFVIPVFVLTYSFTLYPADFGGELGRLSFLVATTGIAVFLVHLLRPEKGILEQLRRPRMEVPKRLAWLWLALGAAVPLALVIAALAGYLYSATILMSHLISTLWLALGITIVHELAARWLLIVQQRLLFRAALERFEADRVAREHEGEATAGEDVPVPGEPEVDVASLDQDTRLLLNVGLVAMSIVLLSAIWSSVLPALTILRDVTLWEYLEGAAGEEKLVPVTLAEFGLALLYGFMTYVSARTLPSLLEVVLRLRGTTDSGSRLAYATLARYLILIVGVSLIAGTVGFHWNNIQWLVAALGVGIGFGLQEIIANFISGLILLVERPIRLGDVVTVGDVSGVVTRMQIRATTVTNWNRQELLVPNQEFVTGRVLNW
ncbi:MAG: mechanosensitive ion channel, partial [Deltaproteobacteria bacterium]|nr:mechanosensitive ion channel [Deltaproteobacteria bacterium]